MTHAADKIKLDVEVHLASLLRLECDLQETFERMKNELESLAGFSVKKAFKLLDKKGRGFLDVNSIRDFIVKHYSLDEITRAQKKKMTFKRQILGLMRRLLTSTDGKVVYTEFAKLIKPVDLRPYLRRIRKYTKEEKK